MKNFFKHRFSDNVAIVEEMRTSNRYKIYQDTLLNYTSPDYLLNTHNHTNTDIKELPVAIYAITQTPIGWKV